MVEPGTAVVPPNGSDDGRALDQRHRRPRKPHNNRRRSHRRRSRRRRHRRRPRPAPRRSCRARPIRCAAVAIRSIPARSPSTSPAAIDDTTNTVVDASAASDGIVRSRDIGQVDARIIIAVIVGIEVDGERRRVEIVARQGVARAQDERLAAIAVVGDEVGQHPARRARGDRHVAAVAPRHADIEQFVDRQADDVRIDAAAAAAGKRVGRGGGVVDLASGGGSLGRMPALATASSVVPISPVRMVSDFVRAWRRHQGAGDEDSLDK